MSVMHPGIVVSNWDDAVPDRAGRYRLPKGALDAQAGLPNFACMPSLELAAKRRKTPPNDIEIVGFQIWFVSDWFRRFAEAQDPGAFEFVKCDTSRLVFEDQVLVYWACGVVRFGSYLDESLSENLRLREELPGWRTIMPLSDTRIAVSRDKLGDARVFSLIECFDKVFVDERFVQACKREKFRGLQFTPV